MGETCARCHTNQDWGTSSWCPNCGFYPTLDAESVKDESWKAAMPVEEESIPEGNLFAQLPAWFWILMGGIVAIVLTGFYIRVEAADAESTRGMIALGILPVALTMMAIAHFTASRQVRVFNLAGKTGWNSAVFITLFSPPAAAESLRRPSRG